MNNTEEQVNLHADLFKPTYGELIDLLEQSESAEDLYLKFKRLHPDITIGRHFYDTVCRIAAPTKPALTGKCGLTEVQLVSYRNKIWQPRIRNKPGM